MFFLCRSCRRSTFSSILLQQHLLITRLTYLSLRAYAATPQPRPYKSISNPVTTRPSPSTNAPPIPLQSVLPTPSPTSLINPPISTHPPPLTLPNRAAADPAYKYYYRLGKAYATFYKTGLKALWTNYRTARRLPNGIWSKSAAEIRKAVRNGTLSRANLQLIRRAKSDLYKLPPFIILWMICGEFTPLVVLFVTGLVPRLIWIPKQVQGAREKAEERRRVCQRDSGFEQSADAMILRNQISKGDGKRRKDVYKYLAQSLGLYSSAWDRYIPALLPSMLVQRRVDGRLQDLEIDDFAITRDGGVKSMNGDEVIRACEERGIDVLGKEESQLTKELDDWVEEKTRSIMMSEGDAQ